MLSQKSFLAFALMTFAVVVSTNSTGQSNNNWITTKDGTGSCQISVPKNWGQPVTLLKGMGKVRTFSLETQKMVSDKMLENTEKRVFYILKSTPTPAAKPSTTYQVSVPGNGFHCTAQLIVQPSHSEDEIKKIAATLTAIKP